MAEAGSAAGGGATVRRFRLISPAVWLAVLGGLAALSMVAMLPLSLLAREFGPGIVAVVIGIPCAGIGVLVARRQPGNPLGWLFLVIRSVRSGWRSTGCGPRAWRCSSW